MTNKTLSLAKRFAASMTPRSTRRRVADIDANQARAYTLGTRSV